jgi:hypothetical protein
VKRKIVSRLLPEWWQERVSMVPETGCWLWMRFVNGDGYGQMTQGGKSVRSHRRAYEEFVGPIAEGAEIDHRCRNRWCCNPDHLDVVSWGENRRRARYDSGYVKACRRGHPMPNTPLYTDPQGKRQCSACKRERKIEWRNERRRSGLPVT